MQLFDNFVNQPPNYVPNNMFPPIPVRSITVDEDTLHPIMDDCHLKGYWWNWGDNISLEIKNQITINLPQYAIYTFEDEDPTSDTEGFVGQAYYNLHDLTSFMCTYIDEDDETGEKMYVWTKDAKFTYPSYGASTLTVPIALKEGEQIVVQLFNFRKEMIKEDIYYTSDFKWELTPDQSLKMVPGIYFLNIHLETLENPGEDDWKSKLLRLTNSYELWVKGF